MEAFARLRYAFVSCLGRLLSDVELNAVSAIRVDQQTYFAKRRLRFAAPVIAAGNLYLKQEGAHTRVLSDRQWRNWETEVYRAIYDIELVTDERGRLCFPAWPAPAWQLISNQARTTNKQNLTRSAWRSGRSTGFTRSSCGGRMGRRAD